MKTIVVTGARGYIGSALVKSLADQGNALRLVSRSAVKPSGGPIKHAEYVQADLREEESWRNLLRGADAVVHLSSRTDLHAAEADPPGDRALNVEPIRALVRAAERNGTTLRVVFASSTTVVGDTNINPVNEQTPDRPCSVYDCHKLECEIMLRDATHRGVLQACSLRLSTVYGYGNGVGSINPNRGILNAVMRGAANGQPPMIYGDGKYLRDYIFVGDVVDAFCRALKFGAGLRRQALRNRYWSRLHSRRCLQMRGPRGGPSDRTQGRNSLRSRTSGLAPNSETQFCWRFKHVPSPHGLASASRSTIWNTGLFRAAYCRFASCRCGMKRVQATAVSTTVFDSLTPIQGAKP